LPLKAYIRDVVPQTRLYFRRRSGIGRSIVAVVVVIVVVVAAAAVAVLYKPSSSSSTTTSMVSSSSTTSTTSTSSSSTAPALNVNGMYIDMFNSGFQPPSSNTTYVGTNATTLTGGLNDIFTVTVNLEYTGCKGSSCPDSVQQVSIYPSSFTVEEVEGGQGPPVQANTLSSTSENFIFGISLEGPPTPYSGNFTLSIQMG